MFEKTIPLNDFITLQRGFDLPASKRSGEGHPVIASTGVGGYHSDAKVKAPGVVIGRSGSIGGGQYIEEDFWPLNTTLWVKDFKGHHPKYVYYLMRGIDFSKFNSGSGVPTLNRNHLGSVLVADIGYELEEKIAGTLSVLDEKIQNNVEMNQTLDNIAQRLFKSWFVDFDPVRANAEGVRFSNLPPEVQSLFPREFVDSKLGLIPKGWHVSEIGKEVDCVGGSTPSTSEPEYWQNGNILWTTPKDLSSNENKVMINTSRRISQEGLKKISSGLLPINTVLMSSRAPVGYLAVTKELISINQGYIAMKCNKSVGPMYVLCWLDRNMENIKQHAGGTTFAEISKRSFRPLPVLVPDKNVAEKYEEIASSLYDRIELNARQNESLKNIRDKILPRLLSGSLMLLSEMDAA